MPPVKIKVTRRVEVAPGVTNYELAVTNGSPGMKKPKIDEAFAKSYLRRLTREMARAESFIQKRA